MLRMCLAAGLLLFGPLFAQAQPTNVRAWYAAGQVFVVWQFPAAPANPTDTVEIYASAAAQVNVAAMTRVGRLFFPEYTGARLKALQPNARLQIPTPAGGTYRLAVNEGVFAYSPRAAGNLFFAVVDTGSVAVNALNSASTLFSYDPVNDPIRPHLQFVGNTPAGHSYRALVVWAEGRDDYDNARPDIPVLADADKNGVPHVFTITEPIAGVPAGPLACLVALHGGEGEYQLFRPGVPARANLSLPLNNGIVVTPDDSIYARVENTLERSNTAWFGYTPEFDPFDALPRTTPADTAVVVNFTSRRIFWFLDWLLRPNSPYIVDPHRVAIVGHSGGGRGTSTLTRQQPERFCAAVCYTPASFLSLQDDGQVNYLRGNWDQNLETNLIGPGNTALGTIDVFTMHTRLSTTERDIPLTRVVYGKRDELGAAGWSPDQRGVCDLLNDSRLGFMIFWDEREHGVDLWSTEENDATDDPAHTDPWPDIGQWVAPVRTVRQSGQYLVDTYRNNQSYPGAFNADADALLVGRQPDPGPGDPDLGDPWGTWGGYLEWNTSTIVDMSDRWECTLFLTGLSATSIDNSPFAQITMDIIPRRPQQFLPTAGSTLCWYVVDDTSGALLQSGMAVVEADGVVAAPGIVVPIEPDAVRLVFCPCPLVGDMNCDGVVTVGDISGFVLALTNPAAYTTAQPNCDIIAADANADGVISVGDIAGFVALLVAP
ncbi:MAG: hypothetical protein SF069_12070 [Phycisphaerae bacterium]|nr:hypothetical protein [Phycisphaerae bacterium]